MQKEDNNTGKEYLVEFDMGYTKGKKGSSCYKRIKAILLNNYPNNMVFVNEDGMYKMSLDAITIMYPLNIVNIK